MNILEDAPDTCAETLVLFLSATSAALAVGTVASSAISGVIENRARKRYEKRYQNAINKLAEELATEVYGPLSYATNGPKKEPNNITRIY